LHYFGLSQNFFKMLPEESIRKYTGGLINIKKHVKPLRKGFCFKLNADIPGDAPKCFIGVYEYGIGIRKADKKSWPRHIAKVGDKWYPSESITEHLLNTIGIHLGLVMAESKLAMAGNQLRFLSKYFLTKNERLIHGAEIIASYLEDKSFVDEIEDKKQESTFLTFQLVDQSIKKLFPTNYNHLMVELVKMYIFDAIIGNNDRHFYNWGVISNLKKPAVYRFTPIYDTARGLFWSSSEATIENWVSHPKQLSEKIENYSEGSKPMTGWDGCINPSHFVLMEKIFHEDKRFIEQFISILKNERLQKIFYIIDSEFKNLLSFKRRMIVKNCLQYRWNRISRICNLEVEN
jgi:hypothetical protein